MTPDQLKAAAQVMLDAAKPGAIVEAFEFGKHEAKWHETYQPSWNWLAFDYRVTQPKRTTPDDLPPVCWVRKTGGGIMHLVRGIDDPCGFSLLVGADWRSLESFRNFYEYSADRKTWTPFS